MSKFPGASEKNMRSRERRLSTQFDVILELMSGQDWLTLAEIEEATGYPPASISAQLRHMRKEQFGGHTVNKRHLEDGLFEYQVIMK